MTKLRISALCVTRDRPQLASWLAWNLNKQTRPADQVIVIDSGKEKMDVSEFPKGTEVFHPEKGLYPSDARQLAQDFATGDVIVWYDDDDWYPKEKNDLLVGPMEENTRLQAVELYPAWWIDLRTGLMERQHSRVPGRKVKRGGKIRYEVKSYIPILPVFATRAGLAQSVEWEKGIRQGSDVTWMEKIMARLKDGELRSIERKPSILILVHNRNVYQSQRPQKSFRFPIPKEAGWPDLSQEEWVDVVARINDIEVP